ncbi:hypothetical protein ON010_g18792 [Phytophthora cinnamomi]|nr:hypothetical protein ON010_g18792 [Phytophthora cinnamomi]
MRLTVRGRALLNHVRGGAVRDEEDDADHQAENHGAMTQQRCLVAVAQPRLDLRDGHAGTDRRHAAIGHDAREAAEERDVPVVSGVDDVCYVRGANQLIVVPHFPILRVVRVREHHDTRLRRHDGDGVARLAAWRLHGESRRLEG